MVANREFSTFLERLHPDLYERLKDFTEDYALGDRPALIWQWRPCAPVEVDVTTADVQDLMTNGADTSQAQSWWYGFKSNHCVNVFSGLSSTDPGRDTGWAAEIHTDGHLIAGLWSFPQLNGKSCLSELHMAAFRDFAEFSRSVAEVIGSDGQSYMTATLQAAKSLQFMSGRSAWVSQSRQPTRDTMQWRVRAGSKDQLHDIGKAMASDYKRAFAF